MVRAAVITLILGFVASILLQATLCKSCILSSQLGSSPPLAP